MSKKAARFIDSTESRLDFFSFISSKSFGAEQLYINKQNIFNQLFTCYESIITIYKNADVRCDNTRKKSWKLLLFCFSTFLHHLVCCRCHSSSSNVRSAFFATHELRKHFVCCLLSVGNQYGCYWQLS